MLAFSFAFVENQFMHLQKKAGKLIEAKSNSERIKLLKNVSETDSLKLAVLVKENCYSFWTSEPTKAQTSAKVLRLIYKFSPRKIIKAYLEWIEGISEITQGNLTSAIERLNESARTFLDLEKEYEAAQTNVAKIYVLALLGNYDEAIRCGKKVLDIFHKYADDLAIGKIQHNIGNLFYRQEMFQQAKSHFYLARDYFSKTNDSYQLAMIENNLAAVCVSENNFHKAGNFYKSALARVHKLKMSVTEAEIEASIGNLAYFRGKFDQALRHLEISRQKYEALKMPHQTAIAEIEIADIYLELNLMIEAASIYEKTAGKLRELKLQGEEARARANFGRVAALLNDTRTARRELKKAARLYVLEKNKVGAATVKLNESKLELDLRNHRKALRLAEEAEIFLNQTENRRNLLLAQYLQAEALRNLSESEKAQKMLARIFTESIKQEQSNTAQAAQISLGEIAFEEKNYRQAEKHFTRAIELIETLRAPLAAEEFRMAFLANKLAPFEYLAKIYLAENKFTEAFLTVEKARARSLAESLSNVKTQTANAKRNDASAKLTGKLEALREELNWFYSRLNRAAETEVEKLQSEAKKREKHIADVMRQISSTDEAKSGRQNFLDFARLQKTLGKQKALLEFVDFDGDLSAFVVTGETIHFIADLGKESEALALLEDLRFQFGSLRYGAKMMKSFLPELKKRADFYLRKLHEKLLAPLADFIENRDLVIVPVGGLHYVPFHALFDGACYQIEKREIIYAPGATVWQFLTSKPKRKLKNALLIGFADERIPLIGREIESLENIFADSKVLTGEQATFAAYAENAAEFDVLHLACHGQYRPENPLFSSLHLADGWITARDIYSQRLKAEVVTLSACETGLHKVFAGDEILGLARGFLSAGAKSLVLSLWTVNDEATAELMAFFYKNLQLGKTASASLRAAQINFIECDAHPYFWSPFALIGR